MYYLYGYPKDVQIVTNDRGWESPRAEMKR